MTSTGKSMTGNTVSGWQPRAYKFGENESNYIRKMPRLPSCLPEQQPALIGMMATILIPTVAMPMFAPSVEAWTGKSSALGGR